MRNVVLFMHTSLDGFVSGPGGALNWIPYNEELEKYAAGIVNTVGSSLYGRTTYEMMRGYWPTMLNNPSASKYEMNHAQWVENIEKIVFSTTMKTVDWNNTRLISGNIAEEVAALKNQPGKDLVVFGSPSLAHTFIDMDLIDEYQLTISPVILGSGVPLFTGSKEKIELKLVSSQILSSGVVGVHYKK